MEVIERPKIRAPIEVPPTIRCPNHECQCVIAYDENKDLTIGDDLMSMGFECPDCGTWVTVKKLKKFAQYPEAFFDFHNGEPRSDNQVQEWVDDCIGYLKKSQEPGEYCLTGSGNTIVIGLKGSSEDGDTIIVAKGYKQLTYFPNKE